VPNVGLAKGFAIWSGLEQATRTLPNRIREMTVLECCESPAADMTVACVCLGATTLLPSVEAPELLICQTPDRRWLVSDRQGIRRLEEGHEVLLQGRRWRLRSTTASVLTLRFGVSQDEEHVRLEILDGERRLELGERAHHESLLLLARRRRADLEAGYTPAECGWLDVVSLERMLGIDAFALNTHLFRARRQMAVALSAWGLSLDPVERRRGQVRFGDAPFEIERAG